ncbi:hypothetical protein DFQ26_008408 [Actinomortierella ambigua]|nr:hypothetical protein DFQ26_008408 [Actinomortierella ambigua]
MAYATRASSGSLDNKLITNMILKYRDLEVKMLGSTNYVELATSRMARSAFMASTMLEELYETATSAVRKELVELTEFTDRHP